MAKYKKVKRYHRSFYSPGMWVKKAVGIIVLVAVVLVVGWLAAPHVLDWATHTWYTVVRNRDLSASSETTAPSAAASSEVTAEPAASSEVRADSEPGSEPAAPAGVIIEGSWGVLDTAAAKDEASLRAAAQQLAQRNKVTVTALFQRAAQVDGAVRPPQRTAEGFPRRLDATGAVIGEPVQPLGIGCRSQHHLEHRTRAESGQTAVNEGGIIGADAGGDIIRVKFRHTGAGQNLPAAHLHDDDAAFAHILGGNRFAGTLNVGIQRQGNGCVGTAGGGLHLRRGARQQIPAGSGGAKHGLGIPRRSQKVIIGLFQPGHTVAVPIQVADQVTGDGGWQIAPGIRHHEHAVCG